ncbi:MAG: thioredoxin family protein, partial [Planctomycetaceae bacterium]|nr:thioredoxin family protein [Planctomycetaceae bacterium]
LYLLGLFRLPHDMPSDHIGVGRFMTAMSFLGLAAYLAVGLYSAEKPNGKVWENIAAFAPPKFKGGNEQFGPSLEHGGVKYALDFQRAVEYAAKHNKPLFLDFTGVNCVNCRKMEAGPLSQPAVTERLKNFVCVQVYADRVPHIADYAESERLLEQNLKLQTNWFGDTALPSYAVIPADPGLATRKNRENLLSLLVGYDPDEQHFAEFLDTGLDRWKQYQADRGTGRVVGKR